MFAVGCSSLQSPPSLRRVRSVQFALNPRYAKSSAEEVYADYLAMEGQLPTETGAVNHAHVPRNSPSTHAPSQPSGATGGTSVSSPTHRTVAEAPLDAAKSNPMSMLSSALTGDTESPQQAQLSPVQSPCDHRSSDHGASAYVSTCMCPSLYHLNREAHVAACPCNFARLRTPPCMHSELS